MAGRIVLSITLIITLPPPLNTKFEVQDFPVHFKKQVFLGVFLLEELLQGHHVPWPVQPFCTVLHDYYAYKSYLSLLDHIQKHMLCWHSM